MARISFPSDFLWGTATAAYQVEGAFDTDGRGLSIWDTFSHTPGRVKQGHTGDVACDQYNRYREDIALMRELGFGAHRFSISWPRVMPSGRGAVNEKGIDYYLRFTEELLEAGIEPWVTLFHWDLPQALQDDYGGWKSRETSLHFAEFCGLIASRLGDLVRNFMTINEFVCFTDWAYGSGDEEYAPGEPLDPAGVIRVRHNALLAHGMGTGAIRAAAPGARVGLAENAAVCVPVYETPEHITAARKAYRDMNGRFLTTVLEGRYPDSYLARLGTLCPEIADGDMELIGAPLDFVGHNMYRADHIVADPDSPAGYRTVPPPPSYPHMHAPWIEITPSITYWGPRFLSELWDVGDIYITENGCACDDIPDELGRIYDTDRVFYLRNHLISAQRAVSEGIPLRGYFC